ncbi:MAG: hypothetical protein AAB783_02450 [Patescibacteria group bacterium]
MFFSVLFPDLHVVAHSSWEGRGANCKLHILTNKADGLKIFGELPNEEATQLALQLTGLPETSPDQSVQMNGDVAATLSSYIVRYHDNVVSYQHLPAKEELFGFLDPPDKEVSGEGIIMWSDMDAKYHVVIVSSKERATRLIKEFTWLEPERQARLLNRIKTWNALETDSKNEQRIDGISAKLLCRSKTVARVLDYQ